MEHRRGQSQRREAAASAKLCPAPRAPPLRGARALPGTLTGQAVVDVLLAVQAAEAGGTLAHVAALGVMAEPAVHAGLGDALVDVNRAPLTLPARSAQAGVTLKIW